MINLTAGNYTLNLEVVNSSNWCKVYFFDSQKDIPIFLGADTLEIICSKLCSALRREDFNEKKIHKHGDLELFWVLSLAERHAAIYASLADNFGIKIFCVEDGGHFLPEFYLEKQDVKNWIWNLSRTNCG